MTEKEGPIDTAGLRALKAQLLEQEIRHATAQASIAEIELVIAEEQERDRLVLPGAQRVLNIYDGIGGSQADDWIEALEHWRLRTYDNDRPITVNIQSGGGSVFSGLALYDQIQRCRRSGVHVITRAQGICASMAVILLQAGTERIADKNVQILVHEVSTATRGKSSDVSDEAAFTKRLNARLLDILAERSTLSAKQIDARSKRKEWWIDADEALALGFVDRVE